MLKPQHHGGWFHNYTMTATCAIGGALESVGALTSASTGAQAIALWPVLALRHGRRTVLERIAHLNDTHRLTRDQIADWVQVIEDTQVAKAGEAAEGGVSSVSLSEPSGGATSGEQETDIRVAECSR